MKSKMTTNSQLSATKPKKTKNKKQKQTKRTTRMEQNHRNGDHRKGYQWGVEGGIMGEKVQGINSINGRYKIDRGEVKNSMGNEEAK